MNISTSDETMTTVVLQKDEHCDAASRIGTIADCLEFHLLKADVHSVLVTIIFQGFICKKFKSYYTESEAAHPTPAPGCKEGKISWKLNMFLKLAFCRSYGAKTL